MTTPRQGDHCEIERRAPGRLALRFVVATLVFAATVRCADPEPPEEETAAIVDWGGAVMVRHGGRTTAAAKGARLVAGDLVTTGVDGRASVRFPGGNTVELGVSTDAVVERRAGAGARLGITLDKGSARAVTAGSGLRLVIGTPFGRADLGDRSEVDISTESGFVVRVGAIDVTRADGQTLTIQAGARFTVGGVVIGPAPAEKAVPGVVLKPLRFTMTAASRQVQVRGRRDGNWRASGKRESLGADDGVRTRGADGTRLQLDSRTGVVLRPGTEIVAKESGLTAEGSAAHLVLRSGAATFLAARDGAGAGGHEVDVAGRHLRIEPGPEAASVEVMTEPEGQTRVVVRLGRATLKGGDTIEAGYATSFVGEESAAPPAPLASTDIDLTPGRNAAIYCGGRVPTVRFVWDAGSARPPFVIELAADQRFAGKILREEVSRPGFVYDQLKQGYWYWRVRLEDGWRTGTILVSRDRSLDCPRCKRINVVEDTGDETTVYFQEKLPAITLRWAPVADAAKYRLRVYAAGALDKPRLDVLVATPTLALAAGRLTEGNYAWSVQGLDTSGAVVSTGAVNGLTLTYDNAVSGLLIRTPRSGATARGGSVVTAGEVALGEKLIINGSRVALDSKGRFSVKVSLPKGPSQIVYQLPGPGGLDRYWVRDVTVN